MNDNIEDNVSESIPETELQDETHVAQVAAKPVATEASVNWQAAQETMRLQKQYIEQLEAKFSAANQQSQAEEEDEFSSLDEDDYTQNKDFKKLHKEIKELKKALKTQVVTAEQQKINQCEEAARSSHDDYDYVLENYAIPLIKNDPALAYKVQTSKNPAETAYKLGKLSDQYEEQMSKQQSNPKAERIIKNASRPVSSHAAGSPLKSQADEFSKMSSQDIWAQSQKYARQA